MKTLIPAAVAVCFISHSAVADIVIQDAYGRVASPMAKAGAAFMLIENTGDEDDRLIAAQSAAAKRIELHTHIDNDGIMQMREIEGGIPLPAQGSHKLKRGSDHLMFMGLSERWAQGDVIPVTLIFEKAGAIEIDIEVDLKRKPEAHDAHNSN